jgi:superoxide reductase
MREASIKLNARSIEWGYGMTERRQVYRCNVCGNIVEVLHAGVGQLVCCGRPMELLREKAEDVGMEKHSPVLERMEGGVMVKVGSTPHPMEEKHYIEWVEAVFDGVTYRKFLKPGDKPEAYFEGKVDRVQARAYCNVHGLWKA